MRSSSLAAAALLVVALGAAGPAAPAQAPAPAAPEGTPATPASSVLDLPDGPRAYLPEELCDKESMPGELDHLERLDGLGGPRPVARG